MISSKVKIVLILKVTLFENPWLNQQIRHRFGMMMKSNIAEKGLNQQDLLIK